MQRLTTTLSLLFISLLLSACGGAQYRPRTADAPLEQLTPKQRELWDAVNGETRVKYFPDGRLYTRAQYTTPYPKMHRMDVSMQNTGITQDGAYLRDTVLTSCNSARPRECNSSRTLELFIPYRKGDIDRSHDFVGGNVLFPSLALSPEGMQQLREVVVSIFNLQVGDAQVVREGRAFRVSNTRHINADETRRMEAHLRRVLRTIRLKDGRIYVTIHEIRQAQRALHDLAIHEYGDPNHNPPTLAFARQLVGR